MSLVERDINLVSLKLHVDSKYFSIAILAWVLHEIMITHGDAISLFWMQRWSISKVLFFINRFAALFTIITVNFINFLTFQSNYACIVLSVGQYVGSLFIILIVSFMLATRVYALWKGYHIVLTIFFIVLCGNICNFLFIYGLALCNGTILLRQAPFTGCVVIHHSKIMWIMFANTLTFEALSIGLIIYKAWPIAKQRGIKTPLFSLLLEDGLAYYLSFTASKLFVVGCLYVPTMASTVTLSTFVSVSVAALAVNRLFLRLQQTMLNKTTGLTDFTTAGISTAKYPPGSGEEDGKVITTVGGSDKGRRRMQARRYPHPDEELFSIGDRDIEMLASKEEEEGKEGYPTASTRRGSMTAETPMESESSTDVVAPTIDLTPQHPV